MIKLMEVPDLASLKSRNDIVGLIPAAGFARRLPNITCSKEVYPVKITEPQTAKSAEPRAVASYLMESFTGAAIPIAYVIIREGKWDIPEHFLGGTTDHLQLSYLVTDATPGTPYTVDKAYRFVKEKQIAFGFPDIVFQPLNAFSKLLEKQRKSGAEIVLGLFPAHEPHNADMVELNENGQIRKIRIKPDRTKLTFTWIIATWAPVFTEYLHSYISENEAAVSTEKADEVYMGDVIQAAIDEGITAETVLFPEGSYIDIGTSDALEKVSGPPRSSGNS